MSKRLGRLRPQRGLDRRLEHVAKSVGSVAAPEAVRQAVGGGCQSGWVGCGPRGGWIGGWSTLPNRLGPLRPQKRSDRRLEEVVKAVGGGYCRLQMPLDRHVPFRGTVAGHRLGALEGGGGG